MPLLLAHNHKIEHKNMNIIHMFTDHQILRCVDLWTKPRVNIKIVIILYLCMIVKRQSVSFIFANSRHV